MNGDFSLGTDPGLRTSVGDGPWKELARYGLGSRKKKRTIRRLLAGSGQGLRFLCTWQGLSSHSSLC